MTNDMDSCLPIGLVERLTGVSKESLRKWEERYGFPHPLRDSSGERLYTQSDVERLVLIKSLLSVGLRPTEVVGSSAQKLQSLKACHVDPTITTAGSEAEAILDRLHANDSDGMLLALRQGLVRHGLADFIIKSIAQLNVSVGLGWEQKSLTVYQEHMYSEVVRRFLVESIAMVNVLPDSNGVVLATPPDEHHELGLLMAQAIFTLANYRCHYLGTELPASELRLATEALQPRLVAISVSMNYPRRKTAQFIEDLRSILAPDIPIWVGGSGAQQLPKRRQGVRVFDSILQLRNTLATMERKPDSLTYAKSK